MITPEFLRTLVWAWDRGMARVLCTIFSRQTLENRDWKRGHEAMSQQILQVDQAMLETTLDRMVRKSVEETLNAMPDASGR